MSERYFSLLAAVSASLLVLSFSTWLQRHFGYSAPRWAYWLVLGLMVALGDTLGQGEQAMSASLVVSSYRNFTVAHSTDFPGELPSVNS
jgi:hypothetical protein